MASSTGVPSGSGQGEHPPDLPTRPPVAALIPPTKRPPARSWYWLALVVFLAGLGWMGGGLYRLFDEIDSLQRVAIPGEGEVTLDRGDYVIYYEGPGAAAGSVPAITVTVTPVSPSAAVKDIEEYGDSVTVTYNWGSHEGRAAFTLEIAGPGRFLIEAPDGAMPTGSSLAIGSSIGRSIVETVLPALVLMVAAIGGAIALAIVRRRRRQRLRALGR
jgi:hypothetical protein